MQGEKTVSKAAIAQLISQQLISRQCFFHRERHLLDRDQERLEGTIGTTKRISIVCLDSLLHPLYQVFDFCQCKHSHRVFLADLGGDSAVLFCKRIWSELCGEDSSSLGSTDGVDAGVAVGVL